MCKVFLVDTIDFCKVLHVDDEDGSLNHLSDSRASRLQDRFEIVNTALCLLANRLVEKEVAFLVNGQRSAGKYIGASFYSLGLDDKACSQI